MSHDILIEIKGVEGESAKKKNNIDVLSWSWGVQNSGSRHLSTGGGAGQASFQDLHFTKYVDKASCKLLHACASGEHITEATLVLHKADGSNTVEYYVFKMKDILVTSVGGGDFSGNDMFTENVTLNFAEFDIEYKGQGKDGKGTKQGGVAWHIAERKKV